MEQSSSSLIKKLNYGSLEFFISFCGINGMYLKSESEDSTHKSEKSTLESDDSTVKSEDFAPETPKLKGAQLHVRRSARSKAKRPKRYQSTSFEKNSRRGKKKSHRRMVAMSRICTTRMRKLD